VEPVARRINVVACEQANRQLGSADEEQVLDLERRMLHNAGGFALAKQVRHVAVEEGDGLGDDIRSFDLATDAARFIEVKTPPGQESGCHSC
jgi:hypothetical protein